MRGGMGKQMAGRKKIFLSLALCALLGFVGCKPDQPDPQSENQPKQDEETVSGAETEVSDAEAEAPHAESGTVYALTPVTYDLSALPAMKNRLYALWEGAIYFRQYSDEDWVDGALWADFEPSAANQKALMCMKPDGELVQVGEDYGCGALLIVEGRLYSQRCLGGEEYVVYSCALDGSDVKDYDSAEVLEERNGRIICRTAASGLSYIDARTGQEHVLVDREAWYLDATEEEIFFYGYQENEGYQESGSGQEGPSDQEDRSNQENGETGAQELTLYSVDYEGTVRTLKMLTRGEYLEYMGDELWYQYPMDIPYFKRLGDRLYFSAGSYNGNAHMYSGGPIYSMWRDGSGCRVEVPSANAFFYLYDDGGNRALYYQTNRGLSGSEDTGMRQALLDGEVPGDVTIPPPYDRYDKPYVEGGTSSVLFYPDTSGVCYVLLTAQESGALGIVTHVDGRWVQKIDAIEYLGGRLFFTVTDLTYNREKSIGWRDYYDRGRSVCYCKELESGEIRQVYEY